MSGVTDPLKGTEQVERAVCILLAWVKGLKPLGNQGIIRKGKRGRQPHNENPKVCWSMSECALPHGLAQGTKRKGGTELPGKRGKCFEENSIFQ